MFFCYFIVVLFCYVTVTNGETDTVQRSVDQITCSCAQSFAGFCGVDCQPRLSLCPVTVTAEWQPLSSATVLHGCLCWFIPQIFVQPS